MTVELIIAITSYRSICHVVPIVWPTKSPKKSLPVIWSHIAGAK